MCEGRICADSLEYRFTQLPVFSLHMRILLLFYVNVCVNSHKSEIDFTRITPCYIGLLSQNDILDVFSNGYENGVINKYFEKKKN